MITYGDYLGLLFTRLSGKRVNTSKSGGRRYSTKGLLRLKAGFVPPKNVKAQRMENSESNMRNKTI